MNSERLLLDTAYIQALLNRADQYHAAALRLLLRVQAASEVWITEAVLVEVANALSAINRPLAVAFIRQCYGTANIHVVVIDTPLLMRGLQLYENRADKAWGLTDCLSFVVMREQGLTEAVTADHHFRQAGFRALMLEP